jgi:cytochrome P450
MDSDRLLGAALAGGDSESDLTEKGGLPPGPSAPGPMQTLQWMYRPIEFMERCRRRYGRIFRLHLGPAANVFVIADPHAAKQVLTADPEYFRAGDTNGIFRDVVGNHSILVMDGPEHLHHRRILLPVVGRHAHRYRELIAEIARARVATWETGSEIRLLGEMEAISFEVMMRIAMGTDGTSEREAQLRTLIPQMMDKCESPFTLIPWFRHSMAGITPYARLMRFIDGIDEILYETIRERRADPLVAVREDALSLLLRATYEDGSPLEDEVIRDELLTMLMAGYETTTAGLTWAFERLLRAPDKLERLVRELEQGDEHYLMAVVKETLRRRPVIPIACRFGVDGRDLPDPRRSRDLCRPQGVQAGALPRVGSEGNGGRRLDPLRRRDPSLPGRIAGPVRARGRDPHGARGGGAERDQRGCGAGRQAALHLLPRPRGAGACELGVARRDLAGRLQAVPRAQGRARGRARRLTPDSRLRRFSGTLRNY